MIESGTETCVGYWSFILLQALRTKKRIIGHHEMGSWGYLAHSLSPLNTVSKSKILELPL